MDNNKERIIEGFENYSIDVSGNVRNIESGKLLRPKDGISGYLRVGIYKNSKQIFKLIHRLVAQTFIDNPENKPQVNHIDNDPGNNSVSNLEWCTGRENIQHSMRQGRMSCSDGKFKGKHNPISKLIESDVLEIRRLLAEGIAQVKISNLFNVTPSTICYIKQGKTWSHVWN